MWHESGIPMDFRRGLDSSEHQGLISIQNSMVFHILLSKLKVFISSLLTTIVIAFLRLILVEESSSPISLRAHCMFLLVVQWATSR